MRKEYNPKKLTKKQRHQKKYIPKGYYCYDFKKGYCPFWQNISNPIRKKEECESKIFCENNGNKCDKCNEPVTYCKFLNYKEYGQFPLGDMCKICGVHIK